jgi:serine/threonine-protein kinase
LIGDKLLHYEITAKLGEGGMGEVYRATDTRLGRDVAIKVLPEAFTQDPERLARFEREAQVLASLNHPRIAAIYGLEHDAGKQFLVLELVEGPTLSERIAAGALPVDEALATAREIAEGLEAAHEAGIVHRDLKPANVKLTTDGKVKVLDFGLAKAWDAPGGDSNLTQSPTLTAQMTQAGIILGTAGYMSPEQARAQEADKRSDIWSFGVILWEMLTGTQMFSGDTVSDVLASVLKEPPDLDKLPAGTPPSVRWLLERALERDPRRRLRDVGEAQLLLEAPETFIAIESGRTQDGVAAPTPPWHRAVPWAVAALALVAVVVSWAGSRGGTVSTPAPRIFMGPGTEALSLNLGGFGDSIVFSPDGSQLVSVVTEGDSTLLEVRAVGQLEGRRLADTTGAHQPFFSPDGQWIGYFAEGLRKISVSGGASFALADTRVNRGGTWSEDGTIYYTPHVNSGILKIPANGGEPEEVSVLAEDERSHRWPHLLPGGKHLLFVSQKPEVSFNDGVIEVLDVATGERLPIYKGGSAPRYVPSGHLVFVREGTLFAAPFDPDDPQPLEQPAPVATGLEFFAGAGGVNLTYSPDGTLLYLTGTSFNLVTTIERLGESGAVEISGEEDEYRAPALSPDGRRLAVDFRSGEADQRNIWVLDLERGTRTRISFVEGNVSANSVWSPDGRWLYFSSGSTDLRTLFRVPADGSGAAEPIENSLGNAMLLTITSISPDGGTLFLHAVNPDKGSFDVFAHSLESQETTEVVSTDAFDGFPSISPNGRWLAYQSQESGRSEVYVRPYPDTGGRWQVSVEGGDTPLWARDGSGIYFRTNDGIQFVSATEGDRSLSLGRPTLAFPASRTEYQSNRTARMFEIAPDGDLIMFAFADARADTETRQMIVFNWFEELKRLVPVD